MRVFVIFVFPLVTCSVDKVENLENSQAKRGLDHSSNIALLNGLSYASNQPEDVNTLPSPTSTIVNIENSVDGTIPVTINTENLALGNPKHVYAPSYAQQNVPIINTPLENNIVYFTSETTQEVPAPTYVNIINSEVLLPTNIQNGESPSIHDNRNLFQTYVPQNHLVRIPQSYPVQLVREVKVPQPYPVHITNTVHIPVPVRVPIEVPKPYAVRVPHPVPVPVHIKVPVPVEKPYPVQIIKTIPVPVEKPVYIRVPQPIQVPVPQPYPVGIPQPVQVQVPFVVRVPGPIAPNYANSLPPLSSVPVGLPAVTSLPELSSAPKPISLPTLVSESTTIKVNQIVSTTTKPLFPPFTGNGLVPPDPPKNLNTKLNQDVGLLNSYVSSKDGGVYRRTTGYQTNENKKT